MDPSLFANVKLKKATTVDKSSSHVLDTLQAKQAELHYLKAQQDVQMDKWYYTIEPFTFKTEFLELTEQIAKALMRAHKKWDQHRKQKASSSSKEEKQKEKKKSFTVSLIEQTLAESKELQEFALVIDAAINEKFGGKPVFMKLSQRSPKDVQKTSTKNMATLFQQELQKLSESERRRNSSRITAMTKAATTLLRVSNSFEVLDLLVRSTRVFEDFEENFELQKSQTNPVMQLVLREWETNIDILMEFRGFVNNGKLNALSQYNHLSHYEPIEKHQELIVQRVHQIFDKVAPMLAEKHGLQSYVIDFVVKTNVDEFKTAGESVQIIELNPFEESTGSCLFSWKTDRKVFEEGPFEFRSLPAISIEEEEKRIRQTVSNDYTKYLV